MVKVVRSTAVPVRPKNTVMEIVLPQIAAERVACRDYPLVARGIGAWPGRLPIMTVVLRRIEGDAPTGVR